MPLLRGGIRHRKKLVPSGTWVRNIRHETLLGRGSEGEVWRTRMKVFNPSRTRSRVVRMAVKRFHPIPSSWKKMYRLTFGNPHAQFRKAQFLLRLNRKYHLGLRLPPTVRLINQKGRQFLVATEMPVSKKPLKTDGRYKALRDRDRQTEILECLGFGTSLDLFAEGIDPKTGKAVVYLVDLGQLRLKANVTFRKAEQNARAWERAEQRVREALKVLRKKHI